MPVVCDIACNTLIEQNCCQTINDVYCPSCDTCQDGCEIGCDVCEGNCQGTCDLNCQNGECSTCNTGEDCGECAVVCNTGCNTCLTSCNSCQVGCLVNGDCPSCDICETSTEHACCQRINNMDCGECAAVCNTGGEACQSFAELIACGECSACLLLCDTCDWCDNGRQSPNCYTCDIGTNNSTPTYCSGCNSCQSECQLSRQTPNTSGQNFFNNIITPAQFGIIKLAEHWTPILNAVENIKNYYANFNYGTKPFSTWTKPNFTALNDKIPASMINDIIPNSVTANQTIITPTQHSTLVTNIKNYTLNTNLCRNCNTGCNVPSCQTTQGCSGCLTDCNTTCQSKVTCGACNTTCQFCIDNIQQA